MGLKQTVSRRNGNHLCGYKCATCETYFTDKIHPCAKRLCSHCKMRLECETYEKENLHEKQNGDYFNDER